MARNAADLAHFVATLPAPPIIVGHSFGGLVLQKYLERMGAEGWPRPAGIAFLAAAPPSGAAAPGTATLGAPVTEVSSFVFRHAVHTP